MATPCLPTRLYAGIGSRATPPAVSAVITQFARERADSHSIYYVLRSGGAKGADTAFETGVRTSNHPNQLNIFLPTFPIPPWAFHHAARFHPNWPAVERMGDYVMRLHARNSLIMLGTNGDEPVSEVICWTPNGSGSGGTGQALRIARSLGIPITDLGLPQQSLPL